MHATHIVPPSTVKIDMNISTYVSFSMLPVREHRTEASTGQYLRP